MLQQQRKAQREVNNMLEGKQLVTLHTEIERGPIEFNAPMEYTIKHRTTGEVVNTLKFQKGPVQEVGLNGMFLEDMLLIAIDQIEHFQASPFASQENDDTLRHLRDALHSTRSRQYERTLRNVQGKNIK